ncbi:hypothetical protein NsoK4_09060 [Nitrosopumilus sp. K4]|uniref:hypothetical protein n=1 Tax=Nitrosopumilus sp. K4 TaxID=2795383 RepID=UPI001BA55237|nr:hypothetical protein [Nitrosopumilus sp. K4]QUC64556.1 hypothetical protein NsoK4_09060 [Nitrosopumilus sp. K4]
MNGRLVFIPIIVAVVGLVIISSFDENDEENKAIFHVTLADPKMYQDGVYSEKFLVEAGEYFFRFVPNGDSPQILSISINGENFLFKENFTLKGTLHETGISQYYTWDYEGQKKIEINEKQELEIMINPNGNFLGTVSVDILEN